MLVKSSLITFLRHVDTMVERRGRTDLYVFGSAVTGDAPDDIDLLVVYDRDSISVDDALALRERVAADARAASIPVDICLLSAAEAAGNPFLAEEGCQPLSSWLATTEA